MADPTSISSEARNTGCSTVIELLKRCNSLYRAGVIDSSLLPVPFSAYNLTIGATKCVAKLSKPMADALPKSFSAPPSPIGTYSISQAGTKGRALFAARDIPIGAYILIESPCIVHPAFSLEKGTQAQNEAIRSLFDKLDPHVLARVRQLANCKPKDVYGEELGIMCTNGFKIPLPVPASYHAPELEYAGLFPITSMCNHSCGPNAVYAFEVKTFCMYLTAVRPIFKGEEICVSYIDGVTLRREDRRAQLKGRYSFECTCTSCGVPGGKVAESDARRAELGQLQEKLSFEKWITSADPKLDHNIYLRSNYRAVWLAREEDLQCKLPDFLNNITLCFVACGLEQEARFWAQKAYSWNLCGGLYESAAACEELLQKPKSHPLWGAIERRNAYYSQSFTE